MRRAAFQVSASQFHSSKNQISFSTEVHLPGVALTEHVTNFIPLLYEPLSNVYDLLIQLFTTRNQLKFFPTLMIFFIFIISGTQIYSNSNFLFFWKTFAICRISVEPRDGCKGAKTAHVRQPTLELYKPCICKRDVQESILFESKKKCLPEK